MTETRVTKTEVTETVDIKAETGFTYQKLFNGEAFLSSNPDSKCDLNTSTSSTDILTSSTDTQTQSGDYVFWVFVILLIVFIIIIVLIIYFGVKSEWYQKLTLPGYSPSSSVMLFLLAIVSLIIFWCGYQTYCRFKDSPNLASIFIVVFGLEIFLTLFWVFYLFNVGNFVISFYFSLALILVTLCWILLVCSCGPSSTIVIILLMLVLFWQIFVAWNTWQISTFNQKQ